MEIAFTGENKRAYRSPNPLSNRPFLRVDDSLPEAYARLRDDFNLAMTEIEAALKVVDPQVAFTAVESVGPKVSSELITSAVLAILAGTAGILVYVWFRFEWQFAVGAMVATLHDVTAMLGTPASAKVGTLGRRGLRLAPVTASAVTSR